MDPIANLKAPSHGIAPTESTNGQREFPLARFNFLRRLDLKFALILALYCISGLLLIFKYRYQISPDTISYISLAQKYLAGDFANAINGIWAPLYTWLLVPFLLLGVEPLLASVIMTVLFGFFTLVVCRSLIDKFGLPENVGYAILFALVPMILSFALGDSPSDFMIVFFLLAYFNQLLEKNFWQEKSSAVLCGVWAAFAYYSKAFALPFFFAHFCCWSAVHYFRRPAERKRTLINFGYGFGTFLVLTIVWIGLISNKYDRITFSTAGKFNYLAAGPESKSKGGPYYYEGLFPPPNETAPNGWEDPTHHEMPAWSPLESEESFKYSARLLRNNVQLALKKFDAFSSLSNIILIAFILLAVLPIERLRPKNLILFPLLSFILYCSGYILIVVETRYLWLNAILLIIMGGYLLKLAFTTDYLNRLAKTIILTLFAASFVIPSVRWLKANIDTKKDVYLLGNELREEYGLSGNIAANKHHSTMYLSYHADAKYFGQTKPNSSEAELSRALLDHDIDYYFVWGEPNSHTDFLNQFKEITRDAFPGLRVFSLKEKI